MYDQQILTKIKEYGKYQYNIDQVLILLSGKVIEKQFRKDFNNKSSEVYQHFHIGKMEAEIEIDKALHTAAKKGNVQAIDMIRMRNNLNGGI